MTKGFENFLGMRSMEEALEDHVVPEVTPVMSPEDMIKRADELLNASRKVISDKQAADHTDALNSIHDEVRKHARDIMELGFNCEPRHAARLFDSSAILYDQAIKTKVAKRRAEMDLRKLELEERKLAILLKKLEGPSVAIEEDGTSNNGVIIVEDRNALLKRLRDQLLSEKSEKPEKDAE